MSLDNKDGESVTKEVRAQNSKSTAPGIPFQPGKSGNPGGRPKMPEELKQSFRESAKDALLVLKEIMANGKDAEKIRAAEIILDRGYGKAVQSIEADITERRPIVYSEKMKGLIDAPDK